MAQDVWTPHRNKTRGKPYPNQRQHPVSQPDSAHSPNSIRRKENLKRYMQTLQLSVDSLALRLEISRVRLADYLEGSMFISNELAMHVEEMLQLPPSWLDLPDPVVPEAKPITEQPTSIADSEHIKEHSFPEHKALSTPTLKEYAAALDTSDHPGEITSMMIRPMQKANMDRQAKLDARRGNIVMLTQLRGSKNQLALLAGTNPSRISLMASGRKPVSDPFAQAIEDGLGVAHGWLDLLHTEEEVPANVSLLLRPSVDTRSDDGNVCTVPAQKIHSTQAIKEKQVTIHETSAVTLAPSIKENVFVKPATLRSAAPSALFTKQAGLPGPIAEALAKTVLRLSETDQLSEEKAFQLLGALLNAEN